ncbi:MAG: Gfo/Idh/MocA family oxidoreductase [Clostridiaceae bacterium]|nr:Gfo/Idh/MocA family oxidoreductase [Clostridiaceae bacterium]
MKTLKVAIIGQGRSGWSIHGQYFKDCGDLFQVVAVADPLEKRRLNAEKTFNCQTYTDYKPLLERTDLDLVVNSTPSYLHVPVTELFLKKGFNVLCEKPLAKNVQEVDRLIAASRESGSVFAIFQQSRFSAYFRKVKQVIDSGVLGRIVQISIAFNGFARRWDWQCIQRFNGGNLRNTGPHPLDQALQLFGGDDMPEVFCRMDRANTFGDAEDYVKLIMTGKNRPLIDLEISSCCAYPCFTYNVQGTCGGMKGSMDEMEWRYIVPSECPPQKLVYEPLETADGLPAYCGEALTWHEEHWKVSDDVDSAESFGTFANMTARYYQMLYRTLAEGAPLEVTPQQIRRQIAVIEECHRQNPLSVWA